MTEQEFSEIQEGDEVLIYADFGKKYLRPVTKVTATQIVVGGARYNRKDGRLRGGSSFNRSHIGKKTPEIVDQVRRGSYVELIRGVSLDRVQNIPTSTLRLAAIYLGLLDEAVRDQTDEAV